MWWYWTTNIALSLLLSAFFAGILIPQILLIAYRRELFDEPDERKIHRSAVPRLGGLAFMPVIFFTVAFLQGVNIVMGFPEIKIPFFDEACQLALFFSANVVLYLVGMADDLIGIRYRAKFVTQIFCGGCLIAAGVWLKDMHGMFGIHALSPWLGYPLTLLVIVYIVNAVNLIDGIDGLASGLSSCALLTYGITFFLQGQHFYSMLSFATLGVLIPFFYYNVFGNPDKRKKIFMGDMGSLTIGLMLSFLSIKLSAQINDSEIRINPMILAFTPLIVPCFDVLRVYFHRIRNHRNPFLPDKNHIHHKFLALGMSHRRVMVLILMLSLCMTACNILLSPVMDITLLLAADLMVWTLGNMWLRKKINERQQKN